MITKNKEPYKAPESAVVGVRYEGLICTSIKTGNSINNWVDGGSTDEEIIF